MNIFVIPSWYPSKNNTLPGLFILEQVKAYASLNPNDNIAISTWGQNDDRLLLWLRAPFSSLFKLTGKPENREKKIAENLIEYFTPTYTWTSRFRKGNFDNILKANQKNLSQFEAKYGKADIIHAHVGFPAGYIAKLLSKFYQLPYVITEHMSPFPHTYFLKNKDKLDSRLADAYAASAKIICVSKTLQLHMNLFEISNSVVIQNLVDEDFFKPENTPPPKNRFVFFTLGRMVPQKGIDVLLMAFAKIQYDAILRIGGHGSHLEKYKSLAKELGMDKKVEWLGELNKTAVLKEYQQCDAFVLASRHESMGIVFAEAMACGKPVIATKCGGPEEFINEKCGFIIEKENETALKVAMENMINTAHDFDPIAIRDYAVSLFSKKTVCSKVKQLYAQATLKFSKK